MIANSAIPSGPSLAVTTSTGVIGVAVGVVTGESIGSPASVEVLAEAETATDRRHAEELVPLIQKLMAETDLDFSDLTSLVVDRGPGRFTGLRVGLTTVRSLAFALDLPVVSVTSLEALAAAHPVGHCTASVDARREEVFQQSFADGVALGDPLVGRAVDLAANVAAGGIVVGDGADRYADDYSETVVPGQNPLAANMLRCALGRAAMSGTSVEPLYLREPDAKPNIKTRPR